MALRIIAGEKKGIPLKAPKGLDTRPTLGRVRESLFMILFPSLPGATVLDLFAGSGALGLEAISRGAEHCVFVEKWRAALEALGGNIQRLDWSDRATVVAADAETWLKRERLGEKKPFDLILVDPPYGHGLGERVLNLISTDLSGWLSPEGIVVLQLSTRDPLAETYGMLFSFRREDYGETRIAFFRRSD